MYSMRPKSIVAFLFISLLAIVCLPALADTPHYTAQFYCSGRWRIENPVWNTWVVFRRDGTYRVFEYVWASSANGRDSGKFVMSLADPLIGEDEREIGRYRVTQNGLQLSSIRVKQGVRALAGDYEISKLGNRLYPYYLEGKNECLISTYDYAPEAGEDVEYWVDDPVVSMKGTMARVKNTVVLLNEPNEKIGKEFQMEHSTEFGNLQEVEQGWILTVQLKSKRKYGKDRDDWYLVSIQMYPQEIFWGWISGKNLELIKDDNSR